VVGGLSRKRSQQTAFIGHARGSARMDRISTKSGYTAGHDPT